MNTPSATTLIRRKREGARLDAEQLRDIATGIGQGGWSEAQVAAFAMAVAWRGMSIDECRDFTLALRDSGRRLSWQHLPGPALDKHSTGGVGDCVSLLLAPMLAACGAYVPMISGRGLGHTGGTLDKLESLPGYNVNPSAARMREVVASVGCAIVGQSDDLVPADRRLYAVRDITATTDVADLMVASILSKKLAGGANALVLDVKTGSGAQIQSLNAAQALADRMLAVANSCGLNLRVCLSDMDQILGTEAGNALEVRAVLDLLCGRGGSSRLRQLSVNLAAELLLMSGLQCDRGQAEQVLLKALDSGAAAERFARMVAQLGGPADLLERPDAYLPLAALQLPVLSAMSGYVDAVDVRALGQAVVALGGGRSHPAQPLDHSVGLSAVVGRGCRIEPGQALAIVHARNESDAQIAALKVQEAICLDNRPPAPLPLLTWHTAQFSQA